MKEIWKDVAGYEGLYQVSDRGHVKSSSMRRNMRPSITAYGYESVALTKDKRQKRVGVHLLVWDAFGDEPRNGHKLQIDHKDNNKKNNHINNLQLLSCRQNIAKSKAFSKKNNLPTGVSWKASHNKYVSQIQIGKKVYHLGLFTNPEDASKKYQEAIK